MPPSDEGKVYLAYAVKILAALAVEGGARERAAERLGIPVRTLSRHIDQLGLGELCASVGESAIWPRSVRQPKQPGRRQDHGVATELPRHQAECFPVPRGECPRVVLHVVQERHGQPQPVRHSAEG